MVPERPGTIRILGVRYILNDIVQCRKVFNLRHRNATKDYKPTAELTQHFEVVILPPMPRLDVSFVAQNAGNRTNESWFPDSILSGQVIGMSLLIKNSGEKEMAGLAVKTTHPAFFAFGDGSHSNHITKDSYRVCNNLGDPSIVELDLPDGVLKPSDSVLIPVWLRGDKIGNHAFRFLFFYSSTVNSKLNLGI